MCSSRQSWIRYFESKEIEQKWAGAEKCDNCFCVIFICYYKCLLSEKKTGH